MKLDFLKDQIFNFFIIGNSYLSIYDLYGLVSNDFDAAASITRASERGLGPGNRDFIGPVKWHRADRRLPFGAQKK
jgi:hypothetical protein